MAAVNHVDSSKNPYHYCFSLCAGGKFSPGNYLNDNNKGTPNRTYFTYEQKYVVKPSFNCDLCDRAFKTEVQYKRHISEHITCGKDGCQFTAHPKVVAAHIRSQHETGLFHLIKKLDGPGEVKKWIEERKRKYPTQKNINDQKLEQEDKIKRGEVLKRDNGLFNKKFGRRRGRGREEQVQDKKKQKPKFRKKKSFTHKRWDATNERPKEEIGKDGGIPAFQGLGNTEELRTPMTKATQVDTTKQVLPAKQSQPEFVNKSLALLMTSYDSEPENGQDELIVSSAMEKDPVDSDSDSAPEEFKTVTGPVSEEPLENSTEPAKKRKMKKSHNRRYPKRRKFGSNVALQPRKQTLLEKLLENDIKHERKVLLCCIRYIVEKNFFENKRETSSLVPKKSALLEGLLKDEIIRERNIILQCIRHLVNNNFYEPNYSNNT